MENNKDKQLSSPEVTETETEVNKNVYDMSHQNRFLEANRLAAYFATKIKNTPRREHFDESFITEIQATANDILSICYSNGEYGNEFDILLQEIRNNKEGLEKKSNNELFYKLYSFIATNINLLYMIFLSPSPLRTWMYKTLGLHSNIHLIEVYNNGIRFYQFTKQSRPSSSNSSPVFKENFEDNEENFPALPTPKCSIEEKKTIKKEAKEETKKEEAKKEEAKKEDAKEAKKEDAKEVKKEEAKKEKKEETKSEGKKEDDMNSSIREFMKSMANKIDVLTNEVQKLKQNKKEIDWNDLNDSPPSNVLVWDMKKTENKK